MLKPGRIVSDYEVDAEVGAGGIATVYRVVDRRSGAVRALKVLHVQTPTIRERLEFEGQIQSALRHPNIVPVHDVLNVDGWPALVMEFIDGPSLQKWLSTHRVKVSTAERLFRGIVDAVALAHEHGLVHRDLKPANILLQTEKGQLVPKVTDFGLARLVLEDQDFALRSRSGIAIGTPGYMALEQLTDPSRVDQRADIFALGCILYELLTGKRAYDGPDVLAIFNRVALGRYIPPQDLTDGLPAHLVAAVTGCLHPIREERIGDCTRLRAVLDGAPLSSSTLPVDPADLDAPRPVFRPSEAFLPESEAASSAPALAAALGTAAAVASASTEEAEEAVLFDEEAAEAPAPEAPAPEAAAALVAADVAPPSDAPVEPTEASAEPAAPPVATAADAPVAAEDASDATTTASAEPLPAEADAPAPAEPAAEAAAAAAADPLPDEEAFADHEAALAAAATVRVGHTPEPAAAESVAAEGDDALAALSGDDEEVGDLGSDAPVGATVRIFTPRQASTPRTAATEATPPEIPPAARPLPVVAAVAAAEVLRSPDPEPAAAVAPVLGFPSRLETAPADAPAADAPVELSERRRPAEPARTGSGLPLPAGATVGGALPEGRVPAQVDPRDARAAIGRMRDQMQPRAATGNVLPFLGVALITVLAATGGLLYWDKQQTAKATAALVAPPPRERPSVPAPPSSDVGPSAPESVASTDLPPAGPPVAGPAAAGPAAPPTISGTTAALAAPGSTPTTVPAPVGSRTPVSPEASTPAPRDLGQPPASRPAVTATTSVAPAAGGADNPATVRLSSEASENFLVPTDPGVSISRQSRGDHTITAKPGSYTVVARFVEGESPYFIDLALVAGASCEVTCKEATKTCTTSGKCGAR